jgi:hypothetical protein
MPAILEAKPDGLGDKLPMAQTMLAISSACAQLTASAKEVGTSAQMSREAVVRAAAVGNLIATFEHGRGAERPSCQTDQR